MHIAAILEQEMTQATQTSMTQAEYLAETAKFDGLRLSFPTARAERLIEGLQAIAELLRDLQTAPTADPNRK
jgi:hypothetical protein